VPSAAGRLWLLQLEGLASSGALQSTQQISAVQQRLGQAGVSATVVRHLGLDGLTLVQLPTEQTYSIVNEAMKRVAGFRFVRSNMLGETPLFSAEASSGLSPVPGQWVLHIDGITGSRAEQLRWAKLYVGGTDSGLEVLEQVGRDGVFMARSSLDKTFESIDQALRAIPGYRRLEANSIGWVVSHLAIDPSQNHGAKAGDWILQIDGVFGSRIEQKQRIQGLLDAAGVNATVVRQLGADGVALIRVDPTRSFDNVDRALRAVPGYRMIEPNSVLQATATPNDPGFSQQYGLHNTGQSIVGLGSGTPDADIDAPEAWDITTGSNNVIVAVLDSGIDKDHQDLAANIWQNPVDPDNGVDDDSNGFVDDVYGYDFIDDDDSPTDVFGHGTAVAGVIGAKGNNGVGVAGVNWNVRLMALKVRDPTCR
jgi:subtilisin family serine protease